MDNKEKISIRFTWWVKCFYWLTFYAKKIGIRFPLPLIVWMSNRAVQGKIGDGPWEYVVTDNRVEDFQ